MLRDEPDDEFWEDIWDESLGYGVPLRSKQPVSRYVVCYDVVSDRRRARVAECMEGWGKRVQKSVFEVVLEKPHLNMMVRQVNALIDPTTDRVSVYPVCAACDSRRMDLGNAVSKPEHQPYLIV